MSVKSNGLARVQVVGSEWQDPDGWLTKIMQMLPAVVRANGDAATEETRASVQVAVTEALEAFSQQHGTPVFICQLNITINHNAPINVVNAHGGGVYTTINNAVADGDSNPQAITDARTNF
jgi:hypothetical protein